MIRALHSCRGSEYRRSTINGPVAVDFSGFLPALTGCVNPGKALTARIRGNPAGFYANLHTDEFTGAAIWDQLALRSEISSRSGSTESG